MRTQIIVFLLLLTFAPAPVQGQTNPIRSIPYYSDAYAVSWANGTETLVTMNSDGRIYLWNASGLPAVPPKRVIDNQLNYNGYQKMIDLNANSTALIAAETNSDVFLWTFATGRFERLTQINDTLVTAISWGDSIYVGTNQSSQVLVYDPNTLSLVETLDFESPVWALDATSQGDLAVGLKNGTLLVRVNGSFQPHDFDNAIQKLKWNDGELFILEGNRLHILSDSTLQDFSFSKTILSFAPSDDGSRFAVGTDNGTITVLDREGKIVKEFLAQNTTHQFHNRIYSLDWNEDQLAIGKLTSGIQIVNTTSWKTIKSMGFDPNITIYIIENDPPTPTPFPLIFGLPTLAILVLRRKGKELSSLFS